MNTLTIENGVRVWRNEDGLRHRKDGPAFIGSNGRKEWYFNGKLHREVGPAKISEDGSKVWYLRGRRHRKDGPAFIGSNGRKEWWLNDVNISKSYYQTKFTNILVQHHLKIRILNKVLPHGSEYLIDQYTM